MVLDEAVVPTVCDELANDVASAVPGQGRSWDVQREPQPVYWKRAKQRVSGETSVRSDCEVHRTLRLGLTHR